MGSIGCKRSKKHDVRISPWSITNQSASPMFNC
jgi:hypothetical protein